MIRQSFRQMKIWPLTMLLPIIPAAAAFLILRDDAVSFIRWWLALTVPGLLFLPFSANFFAQSPDRGFLFAKPLGLALPGLAIWTLSYLGVLPFKALPIWCAILAGGALIHVRPENRLFWKRTIQKPSVMVHFALEETLFGSSLLLWTFARGLSPALDSLEKFMDYGFMMSLWRTSFLPAKDMWLAGSSINYYYFGQYLMTYWAKAAGIHPEKAYNLAMASLFALTLCLSFAIALLIGVEIRKAYPRTHRAFPMTFAASAAVLLTVGGNGHIFYYGGNPVGNWLHRLFTRWGLPVGELNLERYWFADATRYIGYNPDTADKTIHEFPYYSFLVADLHAHAVNLILVLLVLAFLMILIQKIPGTRIIIAGLEIDRRIVLLSVLLAAFMMGNYWDFVIYFAVACLVLLLSNDHPESRVAVGIALPLTAAQAILLMAPFLLLENAFAAVLAFGFAALFSQMAATRFPHPLTNTGAKACLTFLLAHLVALPFNAGFEPIAKEIRRTVSQTPIIQLWILYGFLLIACFVFILDTLPIGKVHSTEPNPPATPGMKLPSSEKLLLAFTVCGLALILIPELVYVVDIYSGDYKRANTMFKFTYQAFVMLSFVLAYVPTAFLLVRKNRKESPLRPLVGMLLLLLFVPSLLYPIRVTTQWLGRFELERYQGIDGIAPFAQKDSVSIAGVRPGELADDYAAIQWFNDQVTGQPVILESFGDSYTDYCRISAYTGLPTVMGWQTHEWLWRTSKATPDAYQKVVLPRQNDVRTLYTSDDEALVRQLINQYQIRYIVIGDLEREKFPILDTEGKPTGQTAVNEFLLSSLGEVAFSSGNLTVLSIP